jgi:hypothetical protein
MGPFGVVMDQPAVQISLQLLNTFKEVGLEYGAGDFIRDRFVEVRPLGPDLPGRAPRSQHVQQRRLSRGLAARRAGRRHPAANRLAGPIEVISDGSRLWWQARP